MKVALCVFIACIFIVYLFTVAKKAEQPGFAVRGILTGEKLGYVMTALAFSSKKIGKGNGISLQTVKKRLICARESIENLLRSGEILEDCEKTFYDNFSYIYQAFSKAQAAKGMFRSLPHTGKLPRLYSFCELLVKSTGGLISEDSVRSAVNTYSAETPFTFAEIAMLGDMLRVALLEYIALYAEKIVYLRFINKPENYISIVAGYNAKISSAIRSLHAQNSFMTDKFVNSLSPVYSVLNDGDATFYMQSESTKRLYLSEIGRIAKQSKTPEKSVASEILFKSARDGKDISHYILSHPKSGAYQRLYIVCIIAAVTIMAIISAFVIPSLSWLYAIIGLPIYAFTVNGLVRAVAGRFVKRRYLPALDEKYLNGELHRTTVLMPCFAATEADIKDAFVHLNTVAAANPQDIFSYAVLFDYPRSAEEYCETDANLNDTVLSEYNKLGKLCDRVCVLVRRRKQVKGEKYFQGYEKKRGAVMDFNRFMLEGIGDFTVKLGDVEKSEYVITLDSDTLTCNCAELVCIKAHPYCKDTAILSMNCKANKKSSLYSKLYAGETGPGRYRQSGDDVAYNLFGSGNYTGKGIYDVKAFEKKLNGFFPDNRILSHDYIEGAVAGCFDSQVNASEDFPQTFDGGFTRDIRWLRGDWQLLPYTRRHVSDKSGNKKKSPLAPISAFSIAFNLVLTLVPVAQLFVLLLSVFTYPFVSVILLALLPQLVRVVFALPCLWGNYKQTAAEILRCVFEFALLPTIAVYKLYAVTVTLYRLVKKRRLLEWSVFAHTKGKITVIPNIVAAVVFMLASAVLRLNVFFYVLSAVFAVGAALPLLVSKEDNVFGVKSDKTFARLTETAKNTFEYFAAQENLYRLPCDCYQLDNAKGWCARTSPTNIGMALVAYASAYELGIIDKDRFINYTEKTVSAVEECEKYKGNLYNWYDCKTLEVLPRRFVSTVDSGNFAVALSLITTYTEGKLRDRINKLIDDINMEALFDNERKLLYIGYDDELKSCTENHYDLLGSESTLTYLFACGYGKIPHEAFYNLDRHGVRFGDAVTVFSWTGGMFEYLMSRLFISPQSDTLYGQAMFGAVRAQIKFASEQKSDVWGISECRYNAFDDCGGNLYRAFGVPDVAHSDLPDIQPYAPYAAFLALPYCTEDEFLANINAFTAMGAYGKMGFCDSVDGLIPVKSYMTHHQGMILAACANAVKSDCIVDRLQVLPQWRAAKLLCGEEPLHNARRKKKFGKTAPSSPINGCGVYLNKFNGLSVTAACNKISLNYLQKKLLRNFVITADNGVKKQLLSGDFYAAESAVWHTYGEGFVSDAELTLLPSPLGVALNVKYRNVSDKSQKVDFAIAAEPVLAREEEYEAHPAYSRMFIETGDGGNYMWARRRKDSVTVVHSVSVNGNVEYSGDKCAFYGRGRGFRFGQNLNPVLSSGFSHILDVGEELVFTCFFAVAQTTEQAGYFVRLAQSPDCVTRFRGATERLAREISDSARKYAAGLLSGKFAALNIKELNKDKPTIVKEITPSVMSSIGAFLADIKALYEIGFVFDTVLFCKKKRNEYPTDYFDTEHEVERSSVRSCCGRSKVCVINCEDDETYERLKNSAAYKDEPVRVSFCDGKLVAYNNVSEKPANSVNKKPIISEEPYNIKYKTGMGGFTESFDYAVDITENNTPSPWCNIISNSRFGTVITESGGGFTFADNSRQQKLTAWSNDPVLDEVSELIALTDGIQSWSIPKKPLCVSAEYRVLHARGYTEFFCVFGGIQARLTEFIPREDRRKMYAVSLTNLTCETKRLGALFAVKAVLGDFQYNTKSSFEYNAVTDGLDIKCNQSGMNGYIRCDRKTFAVGADADNGELKLYSSGFSGVRYCGVIAPAEIKPGETVKVNFSLSVEDETCFYELEEDLEQARLFYQKLPKVTFDGELGYLTHWLPYQVYNSRIAARTGFYQVSGAYGFRDQLQDCLAMLYCNPDIVRNHIIDCAGHQFKEGDVQHWWHMPAIGVRTHICDDRLWLVYTVCEYISQTGDKTILDEYAPFLEDVAISPSDVSVYKDTGLSGFNATVYEHCIRAITVSVDLGDNGLVLMRGGDWNDAMDKVGERGIGTSVWCTMFLYHVTERFSAYVKDVDLCDKFRKLCKRLYNAVCRAYEDDRFLRAYCDDGRVLGSKSSPSCSIDILTQSWSVISGIGSTEMKLTALDTAFGILCDSENKLIKLFDPPFTKSEGVGYIGDYPICVRENGGQYTQAAVWYVWALYSIGQYERAYELLKWLSPKERCATEEGVYKYCVEPYVSAADVYGGEAAGKGGWTWYTGSASWLYKCIIEKYAGIKMRGDVISFEPKLPAKTEELNVTVLFGGERINIKIVNSPLCSGEWRVRIGEVIYNTSSLKLTKGLIGKKIAVIRLPK